MPTAITHDVSVSVETGFQEERQTADGNTFFFLYKIQIKNLSDQTIQLISRRWEISDPGNGIRVVEGDGVVGVQPVLKPGEQHEYVSGCNLLSDIGRMQGSYFFKREGEEGLIEVTIPSFQLTAPFRMN